MRSRPYRNNLIIEAIKALFFSGENAISKRFAYRFATSQGPDGESHYEVPEPMVALVGTAVSVYGTTDKYCTNQIKMYVSLLEWRSGTFHALEFASNSFIDMYEGHMGTFEYIREHRQRAYRAMLVDIFMKARYVHNFYCTNIILTSPWQCISNGQCKVNFYCGN